LGRGSGAGGGAGGRSRVSAVAGAAWSTPEKFAASAYDAAEAAARKWPERNGGRMETESSGAGKQPSGPYRPAVFGDRKVFIDHAHAMAATRGYKGSLDDFKAELVAASRAGRITLARADLVEAMHPMSVARSEVFPLGGGGGGRFDDRRPRVHFIVLEGRTRA
jgi:hypothetical protein